MTFFSVPFILSFFYLTFLFSPFSASFCLINLLFLHLPETNFGQHNTLGLISLISVLRSLVVHEGTFLVLSVFLYPAWLDAVAVLTACLLSLATDWALKNRLLSQEILTESGVYPDPLMNQSQRRNTRSKKSWDILMSPWLNSKILYG